MKSKFLCEFFDKLSRDENIYKEHVAERRSAAMRRVEKSHTDMMESYCPFWSDGEGESKCLMDCVHYEKGRVLEVPAVGGGVNFVVKLSKCRLWK